MLNTGTQYFPVDSMHTSRQSFSWSHLAKRFKSELKVVKRLFILRKLCEQKGVEIIEAEACPDHIHMLLSIPPKYSVSQIMGHLKGKSSLMIFDRHANLKYKYGNRNFWARGYYVDTVGRNKKAIQEYIRNQLKEDELADQMTIKEYYDPFTGEKYPQRGGNGKGPFTGGKKP